MIELKPCPFCGGDAEIFNTGDYWKKTFYRIYCKKFCCMQGNLYSSEIAAAEAWNRRANEAQPVQPEIIRCKDCRWYLEDEYGGWCTEVNERPTEENDYCSYTERKTDGFD